tara:strand:- start:189 stop:377 length:189 start_codon:yes stop_codon:yes gene_type:complete
MLSLGYDWDTIHQDVVHTCRELMRFVIGGMVRDSAWVEDDDISEKSFLQQPSILDVEACSYS